MPKLLPTLIAAMLGGFALASQAEDLVQIYDRAVVSDPTLRQAEQTLFATREAGPQARALLLPNLGLQGNLQFQNVDSTGINSFGRDFEANQSYQTREVQAVLTQPVFNRASWMQLKQSKNVIAQAEAVYRSAQIDLMVKTTEAYFGVLRASDQVAVQDSLVKANERQLDQSKQRYEVGLVAITDVNESQAAYDKSVADLITARRQLDNAWEVLRTIVGPVSVPLARLGDKLPLSPPEPNDIAAWWDAAIHNNYDIIAASEAANAAQKSIEIERSGAYPTVNLQAGYDMSRSEAQTYTDADTAYVGLAVKVPIFQGGAVASRTREAGYKFRAAQDQLDQVRRQIDKQVKDSFRGVITSIEDVKARQAAVVSARSSLESTQAGFEVGTRTQVDVLNAQRDLFQAEFNYLDSRYTYIINGLKLHQATSTLSRDILVRGNAWLNGGDLVQPPAN